MEILFLASFIACGTAMRMSVTSDVYALKFHAKFIPSDLDDFDNTSNSQMLSSTPTISGPYADGIYQGRCPFQEWYSTLPKGYEDWQRLLMGKFWDSWKGAGSPTGIRINDHNYNTQLGQGNTLGFVGAKLTIHEGFSSTRYGLFAKSGTIPAVVRFSDFGADTSTQRLARIALKVPLGSAWAGEVNLLFTETLDVFPIANYAELSSFAGDASASWSSRLWNSLSMMGHAIYVLGFRNFGSIIMGNAFESEVLAKKYYSQLPYMLGQHQAMKFSLVPDQKTCEPGQTKCCLPKGTRPTEADAYDFAMQRARVTAAYLSECDAVFQLQLQVKPLSENNHEMVFQEAATQWSERPVTVATLTIPQQRCHNDTAVSEMLQMSIASELGLQPEIVDKAFDFHPIKTHEANRPIGEINSFRAGFYSKHAKLRFEGMQNGVFKQKDGGSLTKPAVMPWGLLENIYK